MDIDVTREFLIKEITNVVCADGAQVGACDFSLLADTMTYKGVPTAAKENGIDRYAGPLSKGFASMPCINFMQSAFTGEYDEMKSFAASIAFGTVSAPIGSNTPSLRAANPLETMKTAIALKTIEEERIKKSKKVNPKVSSKSSPSSKNKTPLLKDRVLEKEEVKGIAKNVEELQRLKSPSPNGIARTLKSLFAERTKVKSPLMNGNGHEKKSPSQLKRSIIGAQRD